MRETAIPVAALNSTWLIPLRSIRVSSRDAKTWVRWGLMLDFGMAVSGVGRSQELREVGRGAADKSIAPDMGTILARRCRQLAWAKGGRTEATYWLQCARCKG